jgi:hypothetical protein
MAMKAMKPAPYTERLMFGAQRATNDPDHAVTNDAQTSARQ